MADNPINYGEPTTVINRTVRTLEYLVDGRRYTLQPGENTVLDFHIPFAMEQNVVPGSGDPLVPSRFESMVGVPGKTPCEALSEDYLKLLPHERIDRSLLPRDRQRVLEKDMSSRDMPRGRVGVEEVTPGMREPGRFN